jgi:hypothetical protein
MGALDRDGAVIGYVFESISRIDIDTTRATPPTASPAS